MLPDESEEVLGGVWWGGMGDWVGGWLIGVEGWLGGWLSGWLGGWVAGSSLYSLFGA